MGTCVVGVGIDLVDLERARRFFREHAERLGEVFTDFELAYARAGRRSDESLGARFAAKEATLKALGSLSGFAADWREIEVRSERGGPPGLRLRGRVAAVARRSRVSASLLSLTHAGGYAAAQVVLLRGEGSR